MSCCWARCCLPCCTADGRDNRICDLAINLKGKRRKLPRNFVCASPVWFVELLCNIAIARFHAISAVLKMQHFTSRPEPRLPSRKDGAWCKIQAITPLSSLTSEVGQRRFAPINCMVTFSGVSQKKDTSYSAQIAESCHGKQRRCSVHDLAAGGVAGSRRPPARRSKCNPRTPCGE